MVRLKARLLTWHRWAGLILGLFLLVQAATGTVLVFRDEIDGWLHPALTVAPTGERQPAQTLLDALGQGLPDHEVARVDFPSAPDRAVQVRLKSQGGDAYLAAIDPYSARIVRHGGLSAWPTEAVFRFHNEFWAGEWGHQLVGVLGLGLVFLLVTGPIIWWPGRARLRKGLSVTFRRGANRGWRELHRSAGAICAVLLLVSATTGVMMVWKEQLRTAIVALGGSIVEKPAPKVAARAGEALLPVDALIAKAQAGYGATRLQQLRFPGKGGRVVAVYLDSDTSARPEASKQVWFDRYTGEDLGHYVAGALPAGNEFIDWLFPVHTGHALHLFGRLLMFVGGTVLAGLALTGAWMWFSLRAGKSTRRRAAAAAAIVRTPAPTTE